MSSPIFDPDDPRLTSYALGESTTDEQSEVEQLLAGSAEARAAVEQTRELALGLEEEFAREQAAYRESHPEMAIPTNIVAFPKTRPPWRASFVAAWKVAAVLFVLGSLVMLTVRRAPPVAVTVTQPASPEAVETSSSMPVDPPAPEPAAAPPAVADAEKLLASSKREANDATAKLDDQPPTPDRRDADAASASIQRGQTAGAMAPGAAPPAAVPPAPAGPSVQEHLAASMVGLRLEDGTFVGGVLLTDDGWCLTPRKPSAADKARLKIVLGDGREVPVSALADLRGFEPALLKIKATRLPGVSFAADLPAKGATLIVASVDATTGKTSFSQAKARETNGRISIDGVDGKGFVFNAAGELLAVEQPPRTEPYLARAKAATRKPEPSVQVRPFTAAERASINAITKK